MVKKEELIQSIKSAFEGVKLEDGTGLFESCAIDKYWLEKDDAVRKEYRQKDEVNDWSVIPIENMECGIGGHSFFDAKGMRFHLPAYMIAQLENEDFDADVVGCLTAYWEEDKSAKLSERFDILSPDQRAVVRDFLLFQLENTEAYFLNPEIQKALETYWTK